jgi:hypothetical protein
VFQGNLTVELEQDGYTIHPEFSVENNGLQKMLASGEIIYAVEVQCVSTWYRKMFFIQNNKAVKLDSKDIHERVEVTPCIIAIKNIVDFTNDDFAEEYLGMNFNINPGDVIGIGVKKSFDALYQNDIIKNGTSIVSICGSNNQKEISCNFNGSVIEVMLPQNQYESYLECGYNRDKYKLLNAVLTIPVLVEAIGIISNDENNPDHNSGYSGNTWYKTIVANLKRYAGNNDTKYYNLLDKPFSSAEILLANNSASVLDYLSQM